MTAAEGAQTMCRVCTMSQSQLVILDQAAECVAPEAHLERNSTVPVVYLVSRDVTCVALRPIRSGLCNVA